MSQFNTRSVSMLLLVGIVLCLLPFVISPAMLPEVTRLAVIAGVAMTLNLLVGATGLISMGQGLFYGLGAYTVAIATIKHGVPYWQSAAMAVALAVPLSFITALISLRARHLFFGLLTMAIGQVAFVLVARSYSLTGGDDGLVGVKVPQWLDGVWAHHYLAVAVLMVIGLFLLRLLASPFGAALGAIRDNPQRVASLGGNPKLYEIAAMVIAGTLATVFGIVSATVEGSVDPNMFSWSTSAILLMMVALGGRSIFLGPLLGAVILEISRAYIQVRSSNSDLVVGLIVIFSAILFPEGLGRPVKAFFEKLVPIRNGVAGKAGQQP